MDDPTGATLNQLLSRWQQRWRQSQTGTILSRIVAWLILGVAMLMSLFLLVFLLMLSWLLIPVMIYRSRRRAAAMQRGFSSRQAHKRARIIEGEVLHKQSPEDSSREKY